jgi:ABC-2 type transport system permease protein
LFLENLRRYWVIPAAGFVAYFFCAIFILFLEPLNGDRINNIAAYAESVNPYMLFFAALFTISVSVALNRYLYAPNSVNAMHALPIGRGRLFFSNTLSGLAMIWVPIIVVYLLMYLFIPGEASILESFAKDKASGVYIDPEFFNAVLLTRSTLPLGLLQSLGSMLLVTGFYYGICTLAGQAAGNSVMHIICCAFVALVLPALAGAFQLFGLQMLYGFTISQEFELWLMRLVPAAFFIITSTPAFGNIRHSGVAEGYTQMIVWYIVIAVLLYAVSAFLYAKRKNEKAGDGTVYKFMEVAFTAVLTLGGAMGLGEIFVALGAGSFPFNFGTLIGAVIAFLIAGMIAQKTLRVFTKANFIQLGIICAVILCVFVGFTADVFGYETRVPELDNVESVEVQPYGLFYAQQPTSYGTVTFKSPENIAALIEAHKSIIAERPGNPDRLFDMRLGYAGTTASYNDVVSLSVVYKLKNGKTLRRDMPAAYNLVEPSAKKIYGSDEFFSQLGIQSIDKRLIDSVNLSNAANTTLTLSTDEAAELLRLAELDQQSQSWEEFIRTKKNYTPYRLGISISHERSDENTSAKIVDRGYYYYELALDGSYANSREWLERTGYKARLDEWVNDVERLSLSLYNVEPGGNISFTTDNKPLVITDKAKIKLAAENAAGNLDYNKPYWEMSFGVDIAVQGYKDYSVYYDAYDNKGYRSVVTLFAQDDSELIKALLSTVNS